MNPDSQLEAAVCLVASNVRDPALRARFLDEACAGDERLRAAVDEMLLTHAEAEDFFAKGRLAVNAPELGVQTAVAIRESNGEINLTDEQLGSRLGGYKLLQKSARAVAEWFIWRNRRNQSGDRWRSRLSSWAWTPRASSPASRRNGRHWR